MDDWNYNDGVTRKKERILGEYHVSHGEPNQPYKSTFVTRVVEIIEYNPDYGDDRMCKCGHRYYRHFDSWEDNYPCGCKYCGCYTFVEAGENE